MKKISPKLLSIAMILLTLLATGGFLAKGVIAPTGGGSTGGWEPEPNPDGGWLDTPIFSSYFHILS